jgi:hypothetical protein
VIHGRRTRLYSWGRPEVELSSSNFSFFKLGKKLTKESASGCMEIKYSQTVKNTYKILNLSVLVESDG